MNVVKLFIAFTFCLFSAVTGLSQPVLEVNSGQSFYIGKNIGYFVDTSRTLGIDKAVSHAYLPCETDILNLGNIPHNVWMRFSVRSKTERELYLDIMAPLLEELEVYQWHNGLLKQCFKGGFNEPYHHRPISTESWLLPLRLESESVHTYYIKGKSGFPFQVPVVVSSKDKFVENKQLQNLFWGVYIGIMLFAFLYNLFIYASVRERRYFYYILYIISSSLFYLGLQGFSFMFIWPDTPGLNKFTGAIVCFTNIVVILFALNFLKVTKKQAGQFYFAAGLIGAFVLIISVNLVGAYELSNKLAQMMSLIACTFYIYIGFWSLKRGIQDARFYVLAWTLFLLFVLTFILTGNNVIVTNFFTTHCIFIGHMTEVLLLSFALADRINLLKKENDKFQQELSKTQLEIQEQTFQTISQEIHDNIGQALSLVKLNIYDADVYLPAEKKEKFIASNNLLTKVIQDLRDLAKTLSTDFINEIGLEQAVQQQLSLLQKTGVYTTRLEVSGNAYDLPPQHELIVFRIVQELLNNIVKHAKAKSILVEMEYQEHRLTIIVRDDGRGINMLEVKSQGRKGLGLQNMQNRIKLLNGSIRYESEEGNGTTAILELPKQS